VRNRKQVLPKPVNCIVCEKPFVTRHSQGKYCSDPCRRIGARSSWNLYAERNSERRKEYRGEYYERNKEKIIARTKAYQRSEAGKAAQRATDGVQRIKNPHKIFAREVVRAALRAGYLTRQPCEVCGETKVEAHHPDYMDPLGIMWLCKKHHIEQHKKEKARIGCFGVIIRDGSVASVSEAAE